MRLSHIENICAAEKYVEVVKGAAENDGATVIALDADHVLAGLLMLRSRIFGTMQQADAASAANKHDELAQRRHEMAVMREKELHGPEAAKKLAKKLGLCKKTSRKSRSKK